VSGGTRVRRCTTALTRISLRAPIRAPVKTVVPVARNTLSSVVHPGQVGAWADQHVIAQPQRVAQSAAQYGVLHDDAPLAEFDPAAIRSQDGSEQDPAVGADVHVPAHDRGRRDIRAGVNLGRRSAMLQQHATNPSH
jgi:hypothetical protein